MIYLAFDLETTGLNKDKDIITELAWAIYDTETGTRPLLARSFLVSPYKSVEDYLVSETVAGLSLLTTVTHGEEFHDLVDRFNRDIAMFSVTHTLTHNGIVFDIPFLCASMEYVDPDLSKPLASLIHMDTRRVEFPTNFTSHRLSHLAAEFGFLNPFPHNALSDVFTLVKLADKIGIEKVLSDSTDEFVIVVASVGYEDREKPKSAGFRWENLNNQIYSKKWVKQIRKKNLDQEKEKWNFNFQIFEEL